MLTASNEDLPVVPVPPFSTRRSCTSSNLVHSRHGQYAIPDAESDITACERQAVFFVRIVLVAGPGIERKDLSQGEPLLRLESAGVRIRDHNRQFPPGRGIRKAALRPWMRIRIGQIGFDVVDGRSIHQVGAPHVKDHFLHIHPLQAHGRQAQRIGPEG